MTSRKRKERSEDMMKTMVDKDTYMRSRGPSVVVKMMYKSKINLTLLFV